MNVLRDGGLHHVFAEVRAPSTLGSFLRAFCHGNVRQLDAVHRRLLAGLAARAPLLPGKDVLAYLDIDACQRRVYGVTKQGAAFGAAKIQGKVDQHPGDEAADLQRRARGLGPATRTWPAARRSSPAASASRIAGSTPAAASRFSLRQPLSQEVRRARFGPGLRPGPRRQARRRCGRGSRIADRRAERNRSRLPA